MFHLKREIKSIYIQSLRLKCDRKASVSRSLDRLCSTLTLYMFSFPVPRAPAGDAQVFAQMVRLLLTIQTDSVPPPLMEIIGSLTTGHGSRSVDIPTSESYNLF